MIEQKYIDRFYSKFDKAEEDECWIWKAGLNKPNGYGRFSYNGIRNFLAHRFSYILYKGNIPNGLSVLHKCDVPQCVNPNHLEVGTHQDNMNDRKNRGRFTKISRRGEYNGIAKLTEDDVRKIRKMYKTGNYNKKDLGNIFGCTRANIGSIINKKSWRHI